MKNIVLIFILSLSLAASGQFTTLSENVNFSATDQPMFGPNFGFNLNFEKNLFYFDWNVPFSGGEIQNTSFGDYGFQITGLTQGLIGATFYSRNWDDGGIDVNYPINLDIQYPTPNTFDKGDRIRLKSNYTVNPSASLTTRFPQTGNVGIELYYNMRFKIQPTLCFFSCYTIFNFDETIPLDTFKIVDVSAAGVLLPCLNFATQYKCLTPLLPYTTPEIFGLSGTFDIPNVSTTSSIGMDGCLYASGEDEYMSMKLEIFKLLASIPSPAKIVLDNLSGGGCLRGGEYTDTSSGGFTDYTHDICLDYTVFSAYFEAKVFNKQAFSFCPSVYTSFKLPVPVSYSIVDPNAGDAVVAGPAFGDSITLRAGYDIVMDYPCNWDYMDITSVHDITNTITNRTYDSIGFNFVMEALKVEIILKGFGPGEYEGDNDSLNGVQDRMWTFGPLWGDSWPLGSFQGIEWFNSSWQLDGFDSIIGTPFQLNPRDYLAEATNGVDVECFGDNTGGFTVNVTNGSAPYTYTWSDGTSNTSSSTSATNNTLDGGNQYVVIEDDNGCLQYASYNVDEPNEGLVVANTVLNNPVSCNGANDGGITLVVNGGTPPYSFAWSTATGSSATVTNAAGGTENVTITDDNGCSITHSVNVPEPTALAAEFDIEEVKCNGGNDGVVEIIVSGGNPPYSFIWSNGATTKRTVNWPAGNHSVDVLDVNGCTDVFNFTVNEPVAPIAANASVTNISCFGFEDGSLTASVSGGTPPYTYQWSDSNFNQHISTTNTASDLYASRWNLTIIDANGCIDMTSYNVTEPRIALGFADTVYNVSCRNGNNGLIDITPFGGTPPYNYNWSNGNSSQDNNNLTAGNYTVNITDNNGCSISGSFTVTQPDNPLVLYPYQLNVTCKDFNDGLARVNAVGGTPGYSYQWQKGDTTSTIDSVGPGTYNVIVTDALGCQQTQSFTITSPDSLLVTSIMDSVRCKSLSDGRITANITGGTLPYDVFFSDSNKAKFNTGNIVLFDSLPAARYFVTVRDSNNCMYTHPVEVLEPDTILWEILSTTPTSCFGGSDGAADLDVTGGVPPYTYQWSDPNMTTTQDLTNAPSDSFDVVITDRNLCVVEGYTFIDQPDSIQLFDTIFGTTCFENEDGRIELTAIGGLGGFSFQWSNGEISQDIEGLATGIYTVIATDANGCLQYDTSFVPQSLVDCIDPPNAFTPDGDGYNDTWILENIENYEGAVIKIFNKWGTILFESSHLYTPWDGTFNGKELPSATYYYFIDLNQGGRTYTGPLTIVKRN